MSSKWAKHHVNPLASDSIENCLSGTIQKTTEKRARNIIINNKLSWAWCIETFLKEILSFFFISRHRFLFYCYYFLKIISYFISCLVWKMQNKIIYKCNWSVSLDFFAKRNKSQEKEKYSLSMLDVYLKRFFFFSDL